jgi:hypothetical protein
VTGANGPQSLEKRGSDLIWEAAGLRPGVPGHAAKTALLISRMRALLREAGGQIGQPEPADTTTEATDA